MSISNYLEKVNKHYQSGHATEHTYRGVFSELINSIAPNIHITNEPSNVTDCGNPDFVITKNKIPLGFIEAKDLGKDLNSKQYKEQFSRYRKALDNLIITDYIWFQFFQNGDLIHEIRIAEIDRNKIKPLPNHFVQFENLIDDFCSFIAQTIKSPKTLAEMMAAKARLLENILENAITSDEESEENTALKQQFKTFKDVLIHDLTPQGFSDIYAQTLAYGMFAARLHDKTLETFSRQEAAELIPKSNPFLRKLFNHVAGIDIDERIVTTVDNLADVFRATNVDDLLKYFGKATETQDPIIHFYETFLAEYNPALRKARGVWYTPSPVVSFIVKGVDEILKNDFGLNDGLADISKTKIEVEVQGTAVTKGKGKGRRLTEVKEVHKVQVLDPATGTGTFLAEVVKFIYSKKFTTMKGVWSGYVDDHLIPRINGFELLMASYSMAHLKLDMLLTETGYFSKKSPRFNIFLTNTLEEFDKKTPDLFSGWLSSEAKEANLIKRESPVMVVLGNPPYSVSSSNTGSWILDLLSCYKKGLNERKINLDDDYIKFIRYGQYLISRTGEGVLAYITNNSFLDGVTHRKMRQSLLDEFDSIYVLNLHGSTQRSNAETKEKNDENVFDIMQGVSITFFVKTPNQKTKTISKLYYADLIGTRSSKYRALKETYLSDINWKEIVPIEPYFFFSPKEFSDSDNYKDGFYVRDLFENYNSGIQTKCDELSIHFSESDLDSVLNDFQDKTIPELKFKYSKKDSSGWTYKKAKEAILGDSYSKELISFRPFDTRHTIYCDYSGGFIGRPREKTMKHMLKDNIGILFPRQAITEKFGYFVTNKICDINFTGTAGQFGAGLLFPLYIYPESKGHVQEDPIPNFKKHAIDKIEDRIGIKYKTKKNKGDENSFCPLDLLNYIYAILFSNIYREKYKEHLKIDFPRIPYPKDKNTFWKLAGLGDELRLLHLMELNLTEDNTGNYPAAGSNIITRKIIKKDWDLYDKEGSIGRIWINDDQYFDNVPLSSWELYIGGYMPAQKWLKDRIGRTLSHEDIGHYQKILISLKRTILLVNNIDDAFNL